MISRGFKRSGLLYILGFRYSGLLYILPDHANVHTIVEHEKRSFTDKHRHIDNENTQLEEGHTRQQGMSHHQVQLYE